ncbi:MAG: DnaJ domain-containing protein [Acidobacteria bacterium]|nr:DnaJ domain-containing protein [Acidobacteriota bacterium]MBI3470494.1 DnaJ domain-containing protein [Candidatus Solibacter usitatus]
MTTTEQQEDYVDFYELLQIDRAAEPEGIQRVYRVLAARYHPDNKETGDIERFLRIKDAYHVLSDPSRRKEYDAAFEAKKQAPIPIFLTKEFTEGIDGESNRRMGVLCLLYTKRRQSPITPSMSVLDLENAMFQPREHLVFTIWYLKAKRFIQSDDRSSLLITADGIDYLEASLPKQDTIHKLLKAAENGTSRSSGSKHFTTGWAEDRG